MPTSTNIDTISTEMSNNMIRARMNSSWDVILIKTPSPQQSLF